MSTNLDTEIRIKSQLIQKHDLEVNWKKATGFIPYKGQLIIYDIEVDKDGNTLKDTEGKLLLPEGRTTPYTYERIKIGDGIHTVADPDLPFVDNTSLKYIEQELTEAQKAQARTNISAAEFKRDFKFVVNGFIMSNWTCEIVETLGSFEDAIPLDSTNLMGAQHWYAIYDYGAWAILGATANGWIPFQGIWTSGLPGLPAYTYSGIVQELPEKTALLNKVFVIEQFITQNIDVSAIGRPGSAVGAEEFNHLTNSATGMNSHAEGEGTQATGYAAHAEGQKTVSSGNAAHTEGYENIASGYTAHAEGRGNNAEGDASHVEGIENDAVGEGAHAEGKETDALGARSHAEGYQNVAEGEDSHAEGYKNLATGGNSHVEGLENVVIGNGSHAEGMSNTVEGGNAHAEGARNVVFGQASHAEGWGNKTYECGDHAEGYETRAGFRVNYLDSNWQSEYPGSAAHAEGYQTRAEGQAAHAEGDNTIASGNHSHAGGSATFAFGDASVAVGSHTFAAGIGSFASGYGGNDWKYLSATLVAEINPAKLTTSYSRSSVYLYESDLAFSTGSFEQSQVGQFVRCCPVDSLGGYDPVRLARITNKGQESWGQKRNYIIIDRPLIDQEDLRTLEENNITTISIDFIPNPNSGAIGNYSHTEGNYTIAASEYQHVQGKYNLEDTANKYAHIVGNGTSNTSRSNAHTLDWSGNAWFAGDVYVGSTSGTNKDTGSKKLATEDVVDTKLATKVEKLTTNQVVYARGTAAAPGDKGITYTTSASGSTLVYRDGGGYFSMKNPTNAEHGATKNYVDTNFIAKVAESQIITGNLAITGDFNVAGKMTIQETETLQIKDNIIEVNSNKINNFTAQSGVVINKNSESAYGILYDPIDDTVKLGLGTNNSETGFSFNENEGLPLTVRDDSEQILEDQAILVFDKAKNKLVYSGFTLESFRASIMTEMKAYLEEYMSTEIEIDENGNTITSLNLTGTEEFINNGDGSQTLKITTGGNN